ncbi:hypothetical protein ASG29_11870 [Sphingomonas sp. Leaf412]|uniref:hypothetical protein n=1 Tax=Sphingomonas sp. Leaf412 TaxID=1736370 RepID=UPI0006FDB6A3|nr:hypothetical protein [Sphingomonas sp. Leaf412]KQT32469.1 hypothetical protein ASG29_11870 [Sphingomonas sp. Leaf412]
MRPLLALLAAASLASPAAAQSCLTATEAEAIVQVSLPEVIRDAGRVCATLPATSLLRRPSGAFLSKYDVAADGAWPAARAALGKLSDPRFSALLMSDLARPLVTSLVAPQVTGQIQAADCPTLDRLVTLLEPLPARNTAGIVAATLQYLKAERAKGGRIDIPDLPVCAAK